MCVCPRGERMSVPGDKTRLLLPALLVTLLLIPSAAAQDEPPASPENLYGEMTADGDLLLAWDSVDGDVLGYRVYENGILLDEVTDPSYLTPPPTASAFTVTAFNLFGESASSNVIIFGSVGNGQNSCIILLPPIVQPSACEELVWETVDWVKDKVPGNAPARSSWSYPTHADS